MTFSKRPLGLQFAALACVALFLWSLQSVDAAPLPQADTGGTDSSNDTLTDPFSTPSYLGTFDWSMAAAVVGFFLIH